jgi:hypothetical protein
VQFANILLRRSFERQHILTAVFQALECRQLIVGNNRHRIERQPSEALPRVHLYSYERSSDKYYGD